MEINPRRNSDRRNHRSENGLVDDFEVGNSIFEVAMGMVTEERCAQIGEFLKHSPSRQFWLLARHDRVPAWNIELSHKVQSRDMRRLMVRSVADFIGQNVTEMGMFSTREIAAEFEKLVALYNERWIATVGTPGLRVVLK